MKRILALDGGGYLGLTTAKFIELMSDEFDLSSIDLFAGTSTGSYIAFGLASGKTPKEIVDYYLDMGPKVFNHRLLRKALLLRGYRYNAQALVKALKAFFGSTRVDELDKHVLVPAYDMATGEAHFFTKNSNFLVWEAARASSSAPTYFKPYVLGKHIFLDGGMYLNNPALCACIQARREWPGEQLEIISLGTGQNRRTAMTPPHTVFGWLNDGVRIMCDGTVNVVTRQLRELRDVNVRRYDFKYPHTLEMDDASPATTQLLLDTAAQAADRDDPESQEIKSSF